MADISPEFQPNLKDVMERVFEQLGEIEEDLEELKFPTGSKASPARSCADILIGHPDATDGKRRNAMHNFRIQ